MNDTVVSDKRPGNGAAAPEQPIPEDDPRRISAEETAEMLRDQAPDPEADLPRARLSAAADRALRSIETTQSRFAVDAIIESVVKPERRWENVFFTTTDRNTVEIWWQQVDAKQAGQGLALEGDTVTSWEDGTEVIIRDNDLPHFVQVMFLRPDGLLGSVIVTAGTPPPLDYVGAEPPPDTRSLRPPSVQEAEQLARALMEGLLQS